MPICASLCDFPDPVCLIGEFVVENGFALPSDICQANGHCQIISSLTCCRTHLQQTQLQFSKCLCRGRRTQLFVTIIVSSSSGISIIYTPTVGTNLRRYQETALDIKLAEDSDPLLTSQSSSAHTSCVPTQSLPACNDISLENFGLVKREESLSLQKPIAFDMALTWRTRLMLWCVGMDEMNACSIQRGR